MKRYRLKIVLEEVKKTPLLDKLVSYRVAKMMKPFCDKWDKEFIETCLNSH
jgi:hypothetical protein